VKEGFETKTVSTEVTATDKDEKSALQRLKNNCLNFAGVVRGYTYNNDGAITSVVTYTTSNGLVQAYGTCTQTHSSA